MSCEAEKSKILFFVLARFFLVISNLYFFLTEIEVILIKFMNFDLIRKFWKTS